jgi:hypothetical protein
MSVNVIRQLVVSKYHMGAIADVVGTVRQSEYTGENRCIPCTVVNVFIAVMICGLLVGIGFFWIGIGAFTAFAAVIYLRGYLVPGTPTITEQYFPERVLRLFGKNIQVPAEYAHDPQERTINESDERESVEVLVATDILIQNEENEIDLSPDFRDVWRKRIRLVREQEPGSDDVRAIYDADTITGHSPTSFVVDTNKSVRWVSEAALGADVAAAIELEERIDWTTFDKSKRETILTGLRLFLRRCPACNGSLSVVNDRIDPCCQKAQIVVQSVCDNCDTPVVDAAVVDTDEDVSPRLRLLRS